MKPTISVIVPVYNVEDYLEECVLSILNQSYKLFELILVNDGSTDKSISICNKYSSIDDRVIVLNKVNGGLADARNKGASIAKGDYITFIDSDDCVSKNYLENLIELIARFYSEIAVVGIEKFYNNIEITHNETNEEITLTGKCALEKVLYQDGFDTSACAMLILKSIVLNNPFPYNRYHEDDYTTYKYYLNANRVTLSTKKQYFYRQRVGSIMHSFGKATIDELDAADNLVATLSSVSKDLEKAAKSKKFSNYCQVYLTTENMKKNDYTTYKRIKKFLYSERWNIILNKKVRFKNRIAALALVFGLNSLSLLNSFKRNK